MKAIIKENTWLPTIPHGWGNGYVVIPKGHPLYGNDCGHMSVHGGINFSGYVDKILIEEWDELSPEDEGKWMIGFDTCHYRDNIENCPKEYVQSEADNLLKQVQEYQGD